MLSVFWELCSLFPGSDLICSTENRKGFGKFGLGVFYIQVGGYPIEVLVFLS